MQILALNNEELAVKLKEDRIAKAKKVEMGFFGDRDNYQYIKIM